jgi:hypothetical protein
VHDKHDRASKRQKEQSSRFSFADFAKEENPYGGARKSSCERGQHDCNTQDMGATAKQNQQFVSNRVFILLSERDDAIGHSCQSRGENAQKSRSCGICSLVV